MDTLSLGHKSKRDPPTGPVHAWRVLGQLNLTVQLPLQMIKLRQRTPQQSCGIRIINQVHMINGAAGLASLQAPITPI